MSNCQQSYQDLFDPLRCKPGLITKSVEALQSKDSTMKWRLQCDEKYRTQAMNMEQYYNQHRDRLQRCINKKNIEYSKDRKIRQYSNNQVELSISNSYQLDLQLSQIKKQKSTENHNSNAKKSLIKKLDKIKGMEKYSINGNELQNKVRKISDGQITFQDNSLIRTKVNYQKQYQDKEVSHGVQALRHRTQRNQQNSKSISLIDLTNQLNLKAERSQEQIGGLNTNGLKQSQVTYFVQNEKEKQWQEDYKIYLGAQNQNESDKNQIQSNFTIKTFYKVQEKKNEKDEVKQCQYNRSNIYKTPLTQRSNKSKQDTQLSPLNLYQILKNPAQEENMDQNKKILQQNQQVQSTSQKTTPRVSLRDIEQMQKQSDQNQAFIPHLKLPSDPRNSHSESKQSSTQQNFPKIGSSNQHLNTKINLETDQNLLNLPSSTIQSGKKILTENHLPISVTSSKQNVQTFQHFDDNNDWEFAQNLSIPDAINQYYTKAGNPLKQSRILNHQDVVLKQIKHTTSNQKLNENFGEESQISSQAFDKQEQLQIKLTDIKDISTKSINESEKTDRFSENNQQHKINTSHQKKDIYRDCTPTSNQEKWISKQLPFQNITYELFPQNKKNQQNNMLKGEQNNIHQSSSQTSQINTKQIGLGQSNLKNINKVDVKQVGQMEANQTTQDQSNSNSPKQINLSNIDKSSLSYSQILGSTDYSSNQQEIKGDFTDEVIGDNKQKMNFILNLNIYQKNSVNKKQQNQSKLSESILSSQRLLRQSISDRLKNVSQNNFESLIAEKKNSQQTKKESYATFYGFVQFKFGKDQKNKILSQFEKQKFTEFLKFIENKKQYDENLIPKDKPISQIMPEFQFHEMKFQPKTVDYCLQNTNLQQMCEESFKEKENDPHNLEQYEDNYFIKQFDNFKADYMVYQEYKKDAQVNSLEHTFFRFLFKIQNKVKDFTNRKYDGWYENWIKKIEQKFSKKTQFNQDTKPDPSVSSIDLKQVKKISLIKLDLLKILMKLIKLNLSLNEVCEHNLFQQGKIIRKYCHSFFEAIKQNDRVQIELHLIQDRYLVYSTDYLQQTPLHWAAKRGYTELLINLIKLRADVEAQDIFGRTPLYYAYREGYKEIAVILMKNKACPFSNKQNDISKYANHISNLSIYKFYRISKKMHIMIKLSSPKLRIEIWKDFQNVINDIH
ncbi:hypothetical protein ABPG74_000519 [Tetrahymena malaccensis]